MAGSAILRSAAASDSAPPSCGALSKPYWRVSARREHSNVQIVIAGLILVRLKRPIVVCVS